jgi:hypothetical protein
MKWRSAGLMITTVLAFKGHSFAQKAWHKAMDTLLLPPSLGNIYNGSGDLVKYDTIPCTYTMIGSKDLRNGFKMVHLSKGYYVDDDSTVQVFFDDRLHRITGVERYYFR